MRPFIQTKPGATFFMGDPITTVIRKDYGEYIMKLDSPGFYLVVNLLITGKNELCLFLNWKHYFQLVTNHKDMNFLLSMLERPCPKLFDLLTNHKKYHMITLHDKSETGIALVLPYDKYRSLPELMGNSTFMDAAQDLASYGLEIYFELREHIPFSGWQTRLKEEFAK